jgi:hypothetical protein
MTGICLDCLHDRADAGKIDRAAEALLARAAVDKNRGDAGVFEHAGQIGSGEVVVVPAETHFGGDGNFDSLHHAAHEMGGFVEFGHHRGTTADAADFAHRAAHVDVHGGDADGFEIDGGVAHFFGDGAEELDGERTVSGTGFDEFEGLGLFFQERAGIDQIGGREIEAAEFADSEAEGQVGVAREWREK